MVERQNQRAKKQPRDAHFDERYLGLTPAEVAMRERMAKKFGRQAQHLDALSQASPLVDASNSFAAQKPMSGVDEANKAFSP